jgi:hypothetical protein
MVKLRNQRAKPFKETDADGFQIGFTGARWAIRILGNGANVRDVFVQADGFGLRGNLPFGSAKEDTDMRRANGGYTGRNGFGFEGLIDGSENDAIIGDEDDDTATGEIGDDFVLLREGRNGGDSENDKK